MEQTERKQKDDNIINLIQINTEDMLEEQMQAWMENNLKIETQIRKVYKIRNQMYLGEVVTYNQKI